VELGVVYAVQPQPPDPNDTHWFEAGAVSLGVEYRSVDPDSLAATYGDDPKAMAEIIANSPDGGFFDTGVSIHVCGTDDGHEYLRFDCFDADPHYHYVAPSGDRNHVVPYDAAAHGDVLTWAVDRCRTRLREMLIQAGGAHVADKLDSAAIGPVLDVVAALATKAREDQRSLGRG
jgi:hypothetical protein